MGTNTSKSTSEGIDIRSTTSKGGKLQGSIAAAHQTRHSTLDNILQKYRLLDASKPTTYDQRKQPDFSNLPPMSQESLLIYNIPHPKAYNR